MSTIKPVSQAVLVPVNSAMASSQRIKGLSDVIVGELFMSRIVNQNGEAAIIPDSY
jgi:hypothetical protein